ncbi:MAG: DUF6502 family protein [Acidiferrobacter sp.]
MNAPFQRAMSRLLRPLVGYAISQGFTFTAFAELLKTLYVDEALARATHQPPTGSDLSLMTGIHRKDVKRLRALVAQGAPPSALGRGTHIAAQLIAAWTTGEDTHDTSGALLSLPLHGENGPSIETLTRRIKADMRPRAILDELVRARAVRIDDAGRAHLLRTAYVPDIPEEKLDFLAHNVGDHMACAFHNLAGKPPFLERALFLDALPAEAADHARPHIEAAANVLLQNLHRELNPLECADKAVPGARRMRVGIYYYEDAALSQERGS